MASYIICIYVVYTQTKLCNGIYCLSFFFVFFSGIMQTGPYAYQNICVTLTRLNAFFFYRFHYPNYCNRLFFSILWTWHKSEEKKFSIRFPIFTLRLEATSDELQPENRALQIMLSVQEYSWLCCSTQDNTDYGVYTRPYVYKCTDAL